MIVWYNMLIILVATIAPFLTVVSTYSLIALDNFANWL